MIHRWWQPLLIPFTLLTLVGQLLYALVVRPSSVRWRQWALECIDSTPESRSTTIWGRPGGQSWGCRVLWFNTTLASIGEVNVHERVHALHGEWVNAVAHAVLVPAAVLFLGPSWWWPAVIVAQLAFGVAYGGHFAFEWARQGFGPWHPAYMRIWSERIAYRVDDEWAKGQRPGAWGE